jgi:hypothetical protein
MTGPMTGGPGVVAPAAAPTQPMLHARIRGHRLVVRLAATGRVKVGLDGHRVTVERLRHHRAVFHLPRAARGKHRVKVVYLGSATVPRERLVRIWRVR